MYNKVRAKEFYVQGKDARHKMAYMEWGSENKEVVICVHGLTRNSRDFDYLAQELSKTYRVICPDIIGRGKSDWLEDHNLYNYDTYVSDMKQFLQYLNIPEINWIGTSMGGLIGIILSASDDKKVIKNMVLNDIGPFIPEKSLQRIAKYISINPKFSSLAQAERYIRDILSPFGIKKDEDWKYITMHSILEDSNGNIILAYDPAISKVFSQADALKDIDLWNLWDKVCANILVLRGTLSDVLEQKTAEYMVKNKDSALLVEFQDIGHAPALMSSEQISIIKNWLDSKRIL
ncbi:Alpha/beta hydrolase [Rickettsiales bacterium Ac37b]|nr:Alpha/beta hydrolase [Rickettsiales bacterium Ac37b]